ncbi:MAG: nuclear transport factor 2 family protein [Solirubrobacterales bacterium]
MNPTEELAAQLREAYENLGGEELAEAIHSLCSPDVQATAFTGGDDAWSGRDQLLEGWLKPEFTRHPGYRKELGRIWVSGRHVAFFHVVRCSPEPDVSADWLGLDIFRLAEGGDAIAQARFYGDTIARAELDRVVDAEELWAAIDRCWSPVTTAANRIGMKQVTELKSIARPSSAERYGHVSSLIEPDAELWSWEAEGLIHLEGSEAIDTEFIAPLLPLLPDFYEAVEETIVFGNALVMIQNPSGTFTTDDGRSTFSAWYNCDIYVFREQRISCLLFGRDTLKDRRQMLAAFDDEVPDVADSVHLAPFATDD